MDSRRTRTPLLFSLAATLILATGCSLVEEASADDGDAAVVQNAARPAAPRARQVAESRPPAEARTDDDAILRETSRSFRNVAKAVAPSVVSLRVTRTVDLTELGNLSSELFGRFGLQPYGHGGQPRAIPQVGEGSGVVYSADGTILTNHHVVGQAERIEVHFSNDEQREGTVIGSDPKSDLAVVRVEQPPADLQPARLGEGGSLEVGDWVLALGAPFGLRHTVTAGIVSAVGRSNVGITEFEDFIQTDAAINPGNSGGPLVDLDGNVVGINTAIASRTGGFQGVGFAIPISMAHRVADVLVREGRIRRGWLGVAIQPLEDGMARKFGLESEDGALVGGVLPDGPAARAGIVEGDVIVSVDGQPVQTPLALRNRIAEAAPGSSLTLGLIRDGRQESVTVALGELPEEDAAAPQQPGEGGGEETPETPGLGLTIAPLTPEVSRALDLPGETRGVVVTSVDPYGPGGLAGLQRGDVIEEVDHVATPTPAILRRQLRGADMSAGVLLRVQRGELSSFVLVKAAP